MNDELFEKEAFPDNINPLVRLRAEKLKDGSNIEFGVQIGYGIDGERRFVIFGDKVVLNLCHIITNGPDKHWLHFINHKATSKEEFFDYLRQISPKGLEFYIWNLQ